MFEVDVKNMTEKGSRGGEEDQLWFGALITRNWGTYNLLVFYIDLKHQLLSIFFYLEHLREVKKNILMD